MSQRTHSMPNAIGMVGEAAPYDPYEVCPACGGIKSEQGQLCRVCQRREAAARQAEQADARRLEIRRERQGRFEAALAAGWTLQELFPRRRYVDGGQPGDPLPTWEQILERDPGVMIRAWWQATAP